MEKLCIDVRGFSEEKKKRVQDAFFKLGYEWHCGGKRHSHLDKIHTSIYYVEDSGYIYRAADSDPEIIDANITYPELMRKAGMDESDPDVIISTPTAKDLEGDIKRVDAMASEPTVEIELTTDLQSIISDYLRLLDSIKDPYARGVIKSQITDLTDLQYQQLTGERND